MTNRDYYRIITLFLLAFLVGWEVSEGLQDWKREDAVCVAQD